MTKSFWVLMLTLLIASGVWLGASVRAQYSGYAQSQGMAGQADAQQAGPENVIIILDASASMEAKMNGAPKIQIAKDVIMNTIRSLPPNVRVGLRVYGHRRAAGGFRFGMGGPGMPGNFMSGGQDCRETQLLVPPGLNNRLTIASVMTSIQPTGKTPITYSLQQSVMNDFNGLPGKKTIILVTDGRETCSYNPCELALDMVRNGVDVKINTVGFGIQDDQVALDQLKCVAMSTKGKFYTANTAADLTRSMEDSMQVQTRVEAKITPGN